MRRLFLFILVAFIGLSPCDAMSKVLVMITSSDPDDTILSGTRYEYKFSGESDLGYVQSCAIELMKNGNLIVESFHPVYNEWDLVWESGSKQEVTNDMFYLHLQKTFGNLVIYKGQQTITTAENAIWASGTGKNGVDKLYMNSDCTLSLENKNNKVLWKTKRTTRSPTAAPSIFPSISSIPSTVPSMSPSILPTKIPSSVPSTKPSIMPSMLPSISSLPSLTPSDSPSISTNPSSSFVPTIFPTFSVQPSLTPSISLLPSVNPSLSPTESSVPSITPTVSLIPSINPSLSPTESSVPSMIPSISLLPTQSSAPSLEIFPSSAPTLISSQESLKRSITDNPSESPNDPVIVVVVKKKKKNIDSIQIPNFILQSSNDHSYEYAEPIE